jgi:ribosomal protein S12 methylthiotransferase
MLGRLKQSGWEIVLEPETADAIVVNTCSFIEDAADESIEVILELAEYKKSGPCRRFVVAGCLPERYREDILPELPEVDVFLGTGAFDNIVDAVDDNLYSNQCLLPDPDLAPPQIGDSARVRQTKHMAYVKIAEGCSKHCTYCIIPKLRGEQKSRPADEILAEVGDLVADGAKELVLVAQDTTNYGKDLNPRFSLGRLVDQLAGCRGPGGEIVPWYRVLYGHPETIDNDFIRAVAAHSNVCSYFDIPIQHASARVLKRMGRSYDGDALHRLFDRIRFRVTDAVLRTTVIVGFPGESDKDFQQLLDFVEKIGFDHLGVFKYSDADDLPSHLLDDHVAADVAQDRYDQLMSAQMDISTRNTLKYVGRTMAVLVEESLGNHMYVGRTDFQAPEVDGVTYINASQSRVELTPGHFATIRITDSMEYDLMGEI